VFSPAVPGRDRIRSRARFHPRVPVPERVPSNSPRVHAPLRRTAKITRVCSRAAVVATSTRREKYFPTFRRELPGIDRGRPFIVIVNKAMSAREGREFANCREAIIPPPLLLPPRGIDFPLFSISLARDDFEIAASPRVKISTKISLRDVLPNISRRRRAL